jgi:arabinofuranan 3-O-arabinosyltransferase
MGATAAERAAPTARFFRRHRIELLGFALLAYVPFLLSSPGRVSADTKQYLYLDPGRLLSRAPYLWDSHVGAGTVPHQNIGYLFPMGPYYWLMQQVGVPDWVAQRLWLGSISFAAAAGVLWLVSLLGTRRTGAIVAALVYMLTPYQLAFTARISVILLPWAALPWLVGLTARALARRGWRDPILFALLALAAGSVNATALLLVGLAPLLWLVVAVAQRRSTARDAGITALRIAVPTVGLSIWSAVGLVTQARYGLPILDVTESLRTVARVSNPMDLLRGLGNWFLAGTDRVGPWLDQSTRYRDERIVTVLTFALPFAALVGAAFLRWKHRSYFVAIIVVGTIVGVGAWPYDDPSPIGQLFKDGSIGSSIALALRNTPRVVPIIVLGVAGLLGAGVSAFNRQRRLELGAAVLVGAVAIGAFLPVWREGYLSGHLDRPEAVPQYWKNAARALDGQSDATRVLEIPGSLFAAYRWGNTIEPITPGLTDRSVLARELLPYGSRETADLLAALDRRMQDGTFEPASLAPVARLLGVGTVLVRSDLEYERYQTPRPRLLWHWLTDPLAPGLNAPEGFGPVRENRASSQFPPDALDASLASDPDPPPVALLPVKDAVDIVRASPAARPVVMAGSGDGIVDSAAAGLVDGRGVVLLATSLDRAELRDALGRQADLVVTDSNRKRARRWDRLREDVGYTERAGQQPLLADTEDHRLDVGGTSSDADRTVVEQRGGHVDATAYGEPERYLPEDRPANAFDGEPRTAWRVIDQPDTEPRIEFRPAEPVRTDHVTLAQPTDGPMVTKVAVSINGRDPVTVDLDQASRASEGQTIRFPSATVRRLDVTLVGTDGGAFTEGGLSEVHLGTVRVEEITRVPATLIRRAGGPAIDHRLVYVLTRLQGTVDEPARQDTELKLVRSIAVDGTRSFALAGTARPAVGAAPPATGVCRDDLVSVDARPVSVRLVGDAASTDGLAVEPCGDALFFGAGRHIVRTAVGLDSGIDIDRLVLTSEAGGAAPPDAAARLGAPPPASGAKVTVTDKGSTSYDLRVTTDGKPFWLVLGQSHNSGWEAKTAAGDSLGAPRLVDGYANGWLVTPNHAGTLTVQLRWTPQRLVWIGLAASMLALLVCLGWLLATRRRYRVAATLAPLTGTSAASELEDPSSFASPLAYNRPAGSIVAAVTVGLSVGVASALASRFWIGALVGVAAFVATRFDGARLPLVAGAPLALALGRILDAPELGWVVVLLLGADLVVGWVRAHGWSRQ